MGACGPKQGRARYRERRPRWQAARRRRRNLCAPATRFHFGDVEEPHFHPLAAVPAVADEAAREMQHLPACGGEREAKRLLRRAEKNAADLGAIGRPGPPAQMAVADWRDVDQPMRRKYEDGF